MMKQYHFEVFVEVDEDGDAHNVYLNAENSASWHEGTVFDPGLEEWGDWDPDHESNACNRLMEVLREGQPK